MIFSSFNGLLLFVIGFLIFLFTRPRWRWLVLLALSLGVLATVNFISTTLMLLQTLGGYGLAFWIHKQRKPWVLWACMALELAPLVIVKALHLQNWPLVPPGLSFYTFQILAYFAEVYWQKIEPERDWRLFTTFNVLFINKTVGPIERPSFLTQLSEIYSDTGKRFLRGLILIWWGLFQKMVIADRLGIVVAPVLEHPDRFPGLPVWGAVLLSKYQIFADFSGGSLVALGLGDLFGLSLTRNFRRPFAATTLREFWRRWHISLQFWIRDYVFYPLLATRLIRLGLLPILTITFILFGLWHGFTLNFVLYGVIQALLVYYAPEKKFFGRLAGRYWRPLILAFNYIFLICLPSILFRTPTLGAAWEVLRHLGFAAKDWTYFWHLDNVISLWFILGFIVLNEIWQWLEEKYDVYAFLDRRAWILKVFLAYILVFILFRFAVLNEPTSYIYSNF